MLTHNVHMEALTQRFPGTILTPADPARTFLISGPRSEVARFSAEMLPDEGLADALLRTAQEERVAVLLLYRRIDADRVREALTGPTPVGAVYARPTQGLQRAAMHAVGRWTQLAGHPGVWRLGA